MSFNGISEDLLKKFLRSLSPEETLFKQGEMGNTMFVITGGFIELVELRGSEEFLVGTLGAGQILGEKALLQEMPYKRTYSARAKAETTLLEFDTKTLKIIANIVPDFTLRILQTAAKRLDRANELIDVLRPFEPAERMVRCITYLARHNGTKVSGGTEIVTSVPEIYQVSSIEKTTIETFLKTLSDQKIFFRTKNGYLLTDENALRQVMGELRDRAA